MKFCAVLIVASIMALHSTFAQEVTDPYCDPALCKAGVTHIACGNAGAFAATCSPDAQIFAISTPLMQSILQKHNQLRNLVAGGGAGTHKLPKAGRMSVMKWSISLAQLATFNALQCEMKHDPCRNTATYRNAGQNLALSTWSGFEETIESVALKQIQAWYAENKFVDMKTINNYRNLANGTVIGHFAQIMQEKAYGVGCAVLRQTKDGATQQFLICNYAVTNFLNQPVYTTATKAGAKCKTGKNKKFPNLCSPMEKYNL